MKMVFTDTAKIRLREVFEYYKEFLGAEKAKQKVQKIKNRTKQLILMPYLVEGNYKIIYHIDNQIIIIDAIFDTRQDPQSLEDEVE